MRVEARADLPVRLSRQREPAGHRRGAGAAITTSWCDPCFCRNPLRSGRAGRRPCTASFRTGDGKKACSEPCAARLGIRSPTLLPQVSQSALVIWGAQDRVLSDVPGAVRAGERIPRVRQVVIPKCGHAPQIERAGLVNRLISRFLRDKLKAIPPALAASRFLESTRPRPSALASSSTYLCSSLQ